MGQPPAPHLPDEPLRPIRSVSIQRVGQRHKLDFGYADLERSSRLGQPSGWLDLCGSRIQIDCGISRIQSETVRFPPVRDDQYVRAVKHRGLPYTTIKLSLTY